MDNKYDILQLLRSVADGCTAPEDALLKLKEAPFEDLGYARIDYHRSVRQGAAEVIYGAGKTPEQIAGIASAMGGRGCRNILITRVGQETVDLLPDSIPLEYHASARLRLYDVGVAGLHRLLSSLDVLMSARCIIAVAGMEGALASVVGGLADCPVIAVPTSVGYGASFGGLSALLSMLNSCASGCSVVNIDNGFGAGYLASRINQMEGLKEE